MRRIAIPLLLPLLFLAGVACSPVTSIRGDEPPTAFAAPSRHDAETLARFSPVFWIHNAATPYNRLGTPVAEKDADGIVRVRVDPERPAIFAEKRTFRTARGEYVNLVYRVHFAEIPFNLVPFTLTAGDNAGLLVVVTLDAAGKPVLVSQSGTCGCYIAVVPTDFTPPDALPEGWTGKPVEIFGETLSPLVPYNATPEPRLLVEVRPAEHRVMDLKIISDPAAEKRNAKIPWVDAPLRDMAELKSLPLPDGTTVSLYYNAAPLTGHVRGAWRPWETLLMSWFSLDFFVGMDKEYGNPQNPFYTSLKPWARRESDFADFPTFLNYWGWRL